MGKRVQTVLFFMRLASVALSIGNVSLCFAVYSGLESMPISRLKKTWKKVSGTEGKNRATLVAFESLRELFRLEEKNLGFFF